MRRLVPAAVFVVSIACGRAPEVAERDVRVAIPQKDDALIDFVSSVDRRSAKYLVRVRRECHWSVEGAVR